MNRASITQRARTAVLGGGMRVRSLAIAAVLIVVSLALCGYPRPVRPAAQKQPSPLLSLELNIPAFRLEVREDSRLVRSYAVAVGTRSHKTPTGDFEIARIVWNPWWYPPDAEWAAEDTVTPPGPKNPMGRVKLMLNGPYYMHGTPETRSLGHAASHGCVRMRNEDVVELALLVQAHGGIDVAPALIDSLTTSWKKTRVLELNTFIPVTIVYHTTEVRDSSLWIYPDVYRRSVSSTYSRAMSSLFDAGVDTALIDRQVVRRLARQASSKAVTFPLSQLVGAVAEGGLQP